MAKMLQVEVQVHQEIADSHGTAMPALEEIVREYRPRYQQKWEISAVSQKPLDKHKK